MRTVFINKNKLIVFSELKEVTKECWDDIANIISTKNEYLATGIVMCLLKHSPSFQNNKWKWTWLSFWWNLKTIKGTDCSVMTWIYKELSPLSAELLVDIEVFYFEYLKMFYPGAHLCDSENLTFLQFRTADRLIYEAKYVEAAKVLCNLDNEDELPEIIFQLALQVYKKQIERIAPAFPHFFSKSDKTETGKAYASDWAAMIHGMTNDPLKYDEFDNLNWLNAIYGINKKIEESKKVKL